MVGLVRVFNVHLGVTNDFVFLFLVLGDGDRQRLKKLLLTRVHLVYCLLGRGRISALRLPTIGPLVDLSLCVAQRVENSCIIDGTTSLQSVFLVILDCG